MSEAAWGSISPVRYYLGQLSMLSLMEELTCRVNLYVAVHILRFDCLEQRQEPLIRANVTAYPEKVDLPKKCLLVRVVHSVPDALQNRSERHDAHASSYKNCNFVLKDLFPRTSKRSINEHPRQRPANGRIDVQYGSLLINANYPRRGNVFCFFLMLEIAPNRGSYGTGETACAMDVDR